jgi:hypothetical protein
LDDPILTGFGFGSHRAAAIETDDPDLLVTLRESASCNAEVVKLVRPHTDGPAIAVIRIVRSRNGGTFSGSSKRWARVICGLRVGIQSERD